MIVLRFIVLFFLLTLINANPLQQNAKQNLFRQQRDINSPNWRWLNLFYTHYNNHFNPDLEEETRNRRSELPIELRPVEGPINIEQLPAMLAARYVKRYPFSQQDDPAIIGR